MFSDYIIFVDESGDHSLSKINAEYPLFVLAFCVLRKEDYARVLEPNLCELKFKWFGHDQTVLHEKEIVRREGAFGFLQSSEKRARFMADINELIAASPLSIVACVIDKRELVQRYAREINPYNLALLFCLETTSMFLAENSIQIGTTHIIVESRSPRTSGLGREDQELRIAFDRIRIREAPLQNREVQLADFRLVFSSKQSNSAGLQVADLIARPIGLSYLRPEQRNRAMDVIRDKLWGGGEDGIRIYP